MAGFREFLTGEVLTSENVNDFLMKQSVMVFVDAAARTAALGAEVAEGMLTYNLDTDQLEVFDGAAFVSVASPPTTDASLLTSGTLDENRLPGRTIRSVRQVTKTDSFAFFGSGTALVPGLSLSFTPQATNSVMLVMANIFCAKGRFTDVRAIAHVENEFSTVLSPPTVGDTPRGHHIPGRSFTNQQATITFFDTPNTTSSTTYRIRVRNVTGSTDPNREVFINRAEGHTGGAISSIVVIELTP